MKPVRVRYNGGFLEIASPFEAKDTIASLPVRSWNKGLKLWQCPGTAESLADLRNACARDGLTLMVDPSCGVLAEQSVLFADAQQAKEGTGLEQPPIRTCELWLHQVRGFHFIRKLTLANRRGVMLALDMATGKTNVAITSIQNLLGDKAKVLVVAPNKVGQNWGMQLERFCPLTKTTIVLTKKGLASANVPTKYHTTDGRAKLLADAWNRAELSGGMLWAVTNYEAVWQGAFGATIASLPWDAVVCDESHKIKAAGSQVSKFMAKFGHKDCLRLALSGTAISENLMDAYGQYRFLDPSVFGTSFSRFRSRYAKLGGFQQRDIIGYINTEEFHRKFFSIAYRVEKSEVLDLPERTFETVDCEMTPEQKRAYADMYDKALLELSEDESVAATTAMSKTMKLRQICSGFVYDDERRVHQVGGDKFDTLAEMVECIDANEPIVVFCEFKEEIAAVRRALEPSGRRLMEISGAVDDYMEWHGSKGGEVIICQIAAGGVGIELQRARYCFFISPTWSLTAWLQAVDRVHRPGQTRPVQYWLFSTVGTVERKVYAALREKKKVVEMFVRGELVDSE